MEEDGEGENDRDEEGEGDDRTRPFEWLTSPASLEPFLLMAMDGGPSGTGRKVVEVGGGEEEQVASYQAAPIAEGRTRKILHVGSGRSALGEYLALESKFGAALVVNADSDRDALDATHRRWATITARLEGEQRRLKATTARETRELDQGTDRGFAEMLFDAVDVGSQPMPYPDGYFDLVVDKSTLDCAICNHGNSDGGGGGSDGDPKPSVADFLWEVHRLLSSDGGSYLLVTFHSVDFIRPMLLAPGLEWDVEAFVLERQTESLRPAAHPSASLREPATTANQQVHNPHPDDWTTRCSSAEAEARPSRTPWSSNGTFEPDEAYQRTVNVLLCRRRPSGGSPGVESDRSEVAAHIDAVMDGWFRQTNPMLTKAREEAIRRQIPTRVPLHRGYEVLFTDSERAHYTYDLFLEDWNAYCDNQHGSAATRQEMTHDMAIQFLREMQ